MASRTLVSTLALLSLANLVTSSPLHQLDARSIKAGCTKVNVALPSSALPAPSSDVVLKYVALGLGTQNYTCANSLASTVPVSDGAVANLYDPTPLLQDNTVALLPELALNMSRVIATIPPALNFKLMGKHFFNKTLTPVFDLYDACTPAKLYGKKLNNTPAPATACKGTKGEGAVDWLYLGDAGPSSGGVNSVYRVETAGGKAPATCDGVTAEITVPYAAEYWFYGPA